jgi:hypothetical protein
MEFFDDISDTAMNETCVNMMNVYTYDLPSKITDLWSIIISFLASSKSSINKKG